MGRADSKVIKLKRSFFLLHVEVPAIRGLAEASGPFLLFHVRGWFDSWEAQQKTP